MKRLMQWMLAAILICGSTVFTSCSKDDNPVNPADNLAEKIIGKWITADKNGQPLPTNGKTVINFVSATKAYVSRSRVTKDSEPRPSQPQDAESQVFPDSKPDATGWDNDIECDVKIEGNTVILTYEGPQGSKISTKYQIESISQTELVCEVIREAHSNKPNTPPDKENKEEKQKNDKQNQRFTKVNRDYKEAILGTWEGHVTSSEGSEYDDGEMHRWEYKADGNFVYYVQNEEGEWVPSSNTLNEYFVDGTLLCTRWIDNDIENREWWEIASIKDGVMKWKALRQREDGSTYTATFQMTKVVE